MIAACAVTVPIGRIPARVTIVRDGHALIRTPERRKPLALQAGDEVSVTAPARFTFRLRAVRYTVPQGRLRLVCVRVLVRPGPRPVRTQLLAVRLASGRIDVLAERRAGGAFVLTPEMLALATAPGSRFTAERNPSAGSTRLSRANAPVIAADAARQSLRILTRPTYTAIADGRGLRLDVWPFSVSPLQRSTRPGDGLVPYWADGQPCSVGCTPAGAIPGWPIRPFGVQHALRAGINELRPANFHVGVDIEAGNGADVYPVQSGIVHIRYPGTGDVNVDVGAFDYWHIHPTVREGQYATAYRTKLGWVLDNFRHVAFSEGYGTYLNPLRPGGVLRPYRDSEPPIIGVPRVYADGRATVGAFDPQSVVERASYETPVLTPAALAWRLYDRSGRALTPLQWALRSSQNYPPSLKPVIFAPGARNPGYACFAFHLRCIPNWTYWLAGGLTPPLPLGALPRGRYWFTVYAWDYAGNTAALDAPLTLPLAHAAAAPTRPPAAMSELP